MPARTAINANKFVYTDSILEDYEQPDMAMIQLHSGDNHDSLESHFYILVALTLCCINLRRTWAGGEVPQDFTRATFNTATSSPQRCHDSLATHHCQATTEFNQALQIWTSS